jgi:hypothetical protein
LGIVCCRIETARGNAITIAFESEYRSFLAAARRLGAFTLVIEGMMPVVIVFSTDCLKEEIA